MKTDQVPQMPPRILRHRGSAPEQGIPMEGSRYGGLGGAIRAQLYRILDSLDFEASERNRRFLKYVVEETLADRTGHIKAYCIATAVFGRDDSFDPQLDPIVRIEASRLRRALEHYYLTAGSSDPIRISIPKGSYVPAFEAAAAGPNYVDTNGSDDAFERPAPTAVSEVLRRRLLPSRWGAAAIATLALVWLAIAWLGGLPPFPSKADGMTGTRHGPAILVFPFEEEWNSSALPDFTAGLSRSVIVGLMRFNNLFVFGPETSFEYGGAGGLKTTVADLQVDFVLTGGTTVEADRFSLDVLLIDAKTGQYLWSAQFAGAMDTPDIFKVRDEIAQQVARALAQPYGIVFTNRVAEIEGTPPELLGSYDCVNRFYQYWKTYRRDNFHSVRACLERAVVTDPGYSEGFAALSLLYSDGYRFGFDDGVIAGDPRQGALRFARRAIELAPNSVRGHHALALAYWLNNEVEQSLDAARRGLALDPNDTELMAELGMRYAWRNQWEAGLPLLREAFARNPGQPSGYRLALFLDHYLNGRYGDALEEARKIEAPDIVYGYLAVAMASGQLGLNREAQAALDRALEIVPNYGDRLVHDLEKRNIHPDLIRVVVEGLRKAGLPVPEHVIPVKS